MEGITKKQEYALYWAWAYCDHHDKSTEFMIAFMEDVSDTDFDTVMDFLQFSKDHDRDAWYQCNPNWMNQHPQKHLI